MAGEIFAITSTIAFVVSSAMFRKVETSLSAYQISAFRTTVGLVTFYIAAWYLDLFKHIPSLPSEVYFPLILSIIGGQVVGDTLYLMTQERIGTTLSIALSTTFPFFTFMIDFLVRRKVAPLEFWLSAILISIGVVLISNGRMSDNVANPSDRFKDIEWKAVGLGLGASIMWAIGTVFTDISLNMVADQQPSPNDATVVGNVIRFPFAVAILWIMARRNAKVPIQSWNRNVWKWTLSASLIGTAIGAYLWAEAARIVGAAFSAIVYSASPLFALPIGLALNGEKINKTAFAGTMITIAGVLLIFL